ncbi:ATP-dependent RNA helicase DEAH11, chloroplastic-like isoform X1 [Nymphaea colorata]|nr:ATP-dependent RNA helicase DEAH11, chloroplastic-like isoform X1 [Nymphaea colorata]
MRRMGPSHFTSAYGRRARPEFEVQLVASGWKGFRASEIDEVILACPPADVTRVCQSGVVAALLGYRQWDDAAQAVIAIWVGRLAGGHFLTPQLRAFGCSTANREKLALRLKSVFVSHIDGLLEGDAVQRCRKKLEVVEKEVADVKTAMKGRNALARYRALQEKVEGLNVQKNQIAKRLEEFQSAMLAVTSFLELSGEDSIESEAELFLLGDDQEPNWDRIHHVLLRECRRLQEGLPIYSCRRQILNHIHYRQVMILTGETGCGKSTQLIQYLADSELTRDGSVICTQPRKIAALSLAQRVGEECRGCYIGKSVICYPSYSSFQQLNTKIIYMTDNCLLQHFMLDTNLSRVSFIVIDEAHERSLNTDLLLALLKKLLLQRPDLRLIIMSATADARKLSEYFFGCDTFHVTGRTYPVDIKYVPSLLEPSNANFSSLSSLSCPYVIDVVKTANKIHKTEKDGSILAFLTSQAEVEWACENFQNPSAVALALHGKLSCDEQSRVFQDYPDKRKVIFATNVAETSLTIPGVKYVIDSGMVKESRFDPRTGTNVLNVCKISQSSANQRSGRAGRTEPGKCYRLYSEQEFQSMQSHQDPEIRRVHLGIAVLKIVALGITNVLDFEFVDSPSPEAVELAIRNLVHLGAVICKNNTLELTDCGHCLVKLGIEPRLGKLILCSFDYGLRREGVILAAVMANASSIFCRIGSAEEKTRSDCLKLQFCHPNGDLFTLLAVYKEWEDALKSRKNIWCWENSVNAKSMRRCKEAVVELEYCLRHELNIIIPSYWLWKPHLPSKHDNMLKMVILSSLSENVAVFSGHDRLGYEVAMTGQLIQLHPSCSLLAYGQKPNWVVYGELLSVSRQYLVCVTAIDQECLSAIEPPPLFDALELGNRIMQKKIVSGIGNNILRRLCGKSNSNLQCLISQIQKSCEDDRISVDVDFDRREVQVFASVKSLDKAFNMVNCSIECETKWSKNECIEKYLFHGVHGTSPPFALFGSGAEVKHLELEKRFLTVEVSHPKVKCLNDKELLMLFDNCTSSIANFYKYPPASQEGDKYEKWGKVTFLSPEAAEMAVIKLNEVELDGFSLKVFPFRPAFGVDPKVFSFPAVKAKITWPRRQSKGVAIIRCAPNDVTVVAEECSAMLIGGRYVHCDVSTKFPDSAVIMGLSKDVLEAEIWEALRNRTTRKILDVHLLRGQVVHQPSGTACEEALLKEITDFVPGDKCHVHMFNSEPKDYLMKAWITFDGNLHLRAAMALDHLHGKVLSCCLPWQRVHCEHIFQSLVSCPSSVYFVIKKDLESLFEKMKFQKDAVVSMERTGSGSFRVKIVASALRTVAQCRLSFEKLMKGKTITHVDLTVSVLQVLFTQVGIQLLKSLERETGTYILFDRHNLSLKAFGPQQGIAVAEKKLVESLLALHREKECEIHLRGAEMPHNLMKEIVRLFGPDLHGLKQKVAGVDFKLNVRRHILSFSGSKEQKHQIENIIAGIVQDMSGRQVRMHNDEATCPICLSEVEDGFKLEACGHEFCRLCLIDQIEAAIHSRDGFPLCCIDEGCKMPFFLVDLRSLLSSEQLDELFRASVGAFVASSGGKYRFCPTPDCPSVYKVADPESPVGLFICGACSAEICTKCHIESHPFMTCEQYKEFKEDPDRSLKEWKRGKEHVKNCLACGYTIEKVDGCNHVECKCGNHICWVCLAGFPASDDCYAHMRSVHPAG